MRRAAILVVLSAFGIAAAQARPPQAVAPAVNYRVVAQYPHDTAAFTEGLVFMNGRLYESTGLVGQSGVRELDLATGRAIREAVLPPPFFGEGLAAFGGHLIQLTWQHGRGVVYDDSLHVVDSFRYRYEGWGLTTDGEQLIESDGSSTLHRWRASDYAPLGDIQVRDGTRPVMKLNELEYVKGRLYANVWLTDDIAVIDAKSGRVTGWIDVAPLRARFAKPAGWDPTAHVPNGIAWNPANGHLYVTGKCWPALFELALEPAAGKP